MYRMGLEGIRLSINAYVPAGKSCPDGAAGNRNKFRQQIWDVVLFYAVLAVVAAPVINDTSRPKHTYEESSRVPRS